MISALIWAVQSLNVPVTNTCRPPCSHLKTVGTSSSSSFVVPESTSMGAPRFGGVGASGGRGDVAGPGATALGRSDTGRWPVGGMGAFSGLGRLPGGSSPPTSFAHWLPMVYRGAIGLDGVGRRFRASATAYRRHAGKATPQCTGLGVQLYGVGAERKSSAAASMSSAVYG